MKRKIAALKTKLTETKNDKEKESDASSDDEVAMKPPAKKTTNAKHHALTRQS
jgi:hypothetical protein